MVTSDRLLVLYALSIDEQRLTLVNVSNKWLPTCLGHQHTSSIRAHQIVVSGHVKLKETLGL